VEQD
jgi:hypothetical protein